MTKEDALLERERTSWLTIASNLTRDKVKVNPEDSPEVAAEEEALAVMATVAADALDLALLQHLLIVCPRCQHSNNNCCYDS
jgi:hypothetical protein